MPTNDSTHTLRLGTRGSQLARWQADWVAARLREIPGVSVELIEIRTQGDVQQVGPIGAIGTQGVFTKELQTALLEDRIDLAVHSLKDLPTDPTPGLRIGAVPARAPVADVLISRDKRPLADLPAAAWIGTGSLRRRSQLLHLRPDLRMFECRGNVETRIRKLNEGQFDAIILAEAGLHRLGFDEHITERLLDLPLLPAVGQGALGIEIRDNDPKTLGIVQQLDDSATHQAVTAERAMLRTLRGGCLAPVAALAKTVDQSITLTGVVCSIDGRELIRAEHTLPAAQANDLGIHVAEQLKRLGADRIIAASRNRLD